MTQDFEGVVRPFQLPETTPPKRVPTSQVIGARNVIINPGAGGSVKTMNGAFSLTQTYYMIKRPKEKEQGEE